ERYRNESIRTFAFFPGLDGWHRGATQLQRGLQFPAWDAQSWLTLMDKSGLDTAIIYPTQGLAMGYISDPAWSAALCRAYNDYIYDKYQKFSPRLKAVAVLPVQDANLAAAELRRAVEELHLV